ncbi:MAG TPA: molybdopterin cofactor-binding domain-containing protein, partial [Vicinamibacterales bacterium]
MSDAPLDCEVERYELASGSPYRFEVERRDFMKVLGGGLVVVAALPSVFAQESGRGAQGRGETADLAAWLHVDDQGKITGYTGKTEIGQNIRTSLAQAIADELRVDLAAVTLVMADTDLVPYDAGTFGSLSTPRMGTQLSRAAATAREMLIDQAAAKWQADRSTLQAKDGRVVSPDGRSLSYGELTRGQKLTGSVAAQPAVTPADKWTVRGRAAKKVDGRAFVTGGHVYTPDLTRPGLVHARVIRPDSYGATIVSVDDAGVKGMAGVTVVRDGEFLGVIAPTERAARRAASAVTVQWSATSGQPSSETIYEHLKKGTTGGRTPAPFVQGDPTSVKAARTFEASYRIPYIAHVPLEPRAAVAEWTGGKLTVWTGTQRPFGVRTELAEAFRIPESNVRVIVPDTGSAYGGKHTGQVAVEAARLAKAAGKPVKLVWTRAEEFTWGYLRPAGVIDIKASVDGAGRLLAWEFDNWNSGNSAIRTPYDVAHQRIAFHPSDSPLPQGSYRGLAATAN